MKNINLSVDFTDPEKELKEQLQRMDARNINIRRNYDGTLKVEYTIDCANPQKDIEQILKQAGARDVYSSTSWGGARFNFKIDDMVDEREFKKKITEILRRADYRVN